MSYIPVYSTRINWENEPSIVSPINATNLNKMDYALKAHDDTLANWDITKANESDLLLALKEVSYDTDTGVFVFTWFNGTTSTIDLNIEKIPVSFSMDANGVITMTTEDGTTYTADVGALIKTYTFTDSSVIDFTVTTDASGNKTVTADIVNGSIDGTKLTPNYLADCTQAKTGAETAATNSEASSQDAEAWAVGTRGGVPVPSTDPAYENNAEYWAHHTSASLAGLNDVNITNPQDKQALTYDANTGEWINGEAAGGAQIDDTTTSATSVWSSSKTNTELSAKANASEVIKWSEATTSVKKNLLPNDAVSQTVDGITFTVNADGSVKLNGTATSNAWLMLQGASTTYPYLVKSGAYTISTTTSLPTGVRLLVKQSSDDSNVLYVNEGENTNTFTIQSDVYTRVGIRVANGTTVNNVTIYPMIRLASIADATYEPYIPDNTELMRYTDNAVLGAKNLLPNKATSQTINGVTFTKNADGSMTANGTNSSASQFALEFAINQSFESGRYILSGCPSGGGYSSYWIYSKNATDIINTGDDTGNGVTLQIDGSKKYTFAFFIAGSATVNITFKPMLRLATDTDDTYVPYAMTNRELTEKVNAPLTSVTIPSTALNGWTTIKTIQADSNKKYLVVFGAIFSDGTSNVYRGVQINTLNQTGVISTGSNVSMTAIISGVSSIELKAYQATGGTCTGTYQILEV